jgi:hypothetical protein
LNAALLQCRRQDQAISLLDIDVLDRRLDRSTLAMRRFPFPEIHHVAVALAMRGGQFQK